ncbi:MAG: hypothetical protein FJ395_22000 [Verrucomicrobia bacterium]|nr:hypothetical protein [Verrucomicrobiota bacterium]
MKETTSPNEDSLQALLEQYSNLLAGDQIQPDRPLKWLLVEREIGIPDEQGGSNRWSLDHLFIDQYAIPTFVEVKRYENTEIRRQIVGQMLDYAANATVYWPAEKIRAQFEARCSNGGTVNAFRI